jgi:nitrate reductase delta subunit
MTAEVELRRGMQAAALCLEYPDEGWPDRVELARQVAAALGRRGEPLERFVTWAQAAGPDQVGRAYVDTFDLRRRCSPYLTYYAFGDTRKRGMALLRFNHAYRAAGFALDSAELPDHLAVVCEFTARAPQAGLRLFAEQRAGLEMLHLALADLASPWTEVTTLIRSLLPEAAPRDLDRALELARSGPPAEEVGLEPFAPPEYLGARR